MSNLEAVRRYLDGWIVRDADAIIASLTDDGTYEDPGTGGPITGDEIRAYVAGLWSAFPDLTFEIESLAETGSDTAAAQWVMLGTNAGSMAGLPPTGRSVRLAGADFFVLRDGRVARVRGYFDSAGVPRQLGLDVIVQPKEIGPFRFGISTVVQTGKTHEPGAFSITYLEARDDATKQEVREGSRAALIDMLKMDGFIAATRPEHRQRIRSTWRSRLPCRPTSSNSGTPLRRRIVASPIASRTSNAWREFSRTRASSAATRCGHWNGTCSRLGGRSGIAPTSMAPRNCSSTPRPGLSIAPASMLRRSTQSSPSPRPASPLRASRRVSPIGWAFASTWSACRCSAWVAPAAFPGCRSRRALRNRGPASCFWWP